MISAKEIHKVNYLIFYLFIGNFIVGISPAFFVDMQDISTAQSSETAKYLWQIANLFSLVACCLYSIKSGLEEKLIVPAGFIVLSIGIGTLFALQTANFNAEVNKAYASGIMAYIPGILLISTYDRFPAWLRIAGLLATLPRVIIMILIMCDSFDWNKHQRIDGAGYFLTNLVFIGWGWYAIKPRKKSSE